jgi:hypothetical protein
MRDVISRAARTARTVVKAAKYLGTCRRAMPRWLSVLLVIGLLPVPGPFDEAVLVAAAAVLWFRYRPLVRVCWRAAQLEAR